MSKYVDEVIKSMAHQPKTWCSKGRSSIANPEALITGYGNTRVLSIISLHIKNKDMPITYIDAWRLECAVKKWFKNSTFAMQQVMD